MRTLVLFLAAALPLCCMALASEKASTVGVQVCEGYSAATCPGTCSLCTLARDGKQLCFDAGIASKLPSCEYKLAAAAWPPSTCNCVNT